jgi:hypothetical protein
LDRWIFKHSLIKIELVLTKACWARRNFGFSLTKMLYHSASW